MSEVFGRHYDTAGNLHYISTDGVDHFIRMKIDPVVFRNGEDAVIHGGHAKELIRCKDCLYRHNSIMCRMYSGGMDTPDNWFCADGKRKDYPEVDAIYFSDGTVVSDERKDGKENGN